MSLLSSAAVTAEVVRHAFHKLDPPSKRQKYMLHRKIVGLRVRLTNAVGGEQNLHPMTTGDLEEMKRVVLLRNPPGALEAVAYLDGMMGNATTGVRAKSSELADYIEAARTRLPDMIDAVRQRATELLQSNGLRAPTGAESEQEV